MATLLPFQWHIEEFLFIGACWATHRSFVANEHQRRLCSWALISLLVVVVWPIGDIAASVSLTVATVQRLVIMLLVAPLLLRSVPIQIFSRLTRPKAVDFVATKVAHPGLALFLVTVLGTLTLSTPLVDWGASSTLGRNIVLLTTLLSGFLLWIPSLAIIPGARRLSPAGRAGFIFVSSLVVTSLSFVWIFSVHSLYPGLHNQQELLNMTPIFDQQLAGFVAKLGCYLPMWVVAFRIFFHAEDEGIPVEESPLQWADVERKMLRIDRQRERAIRRHQPD
jgi:cytochrome c oxidase assembly factor CtaG